MSEWIRDMERASEHDLVVMERHVPARKARSVKTGRDSRDNRDTAPQLASSVPAAPGQDRDSRDKTDKKDSGPGFVLVESGADRQDGMKRPGVYWCDPDPSWICSPLKVAALTRDAQGGEWGRLLVFADRDGREHRWTCPQSMHAGNGDELRAVLLREGLTITTNAKLRRLVGDYVQQAHPEVRARCVNRTGWYGDVYVSPRETFGDSDAEPVLFQATTIDGVALGQGGTLAGWIEHVAAPCTGNSRLVLAVSMAFAGPCLGLVAVDGGGINFRGPSSCGKTTAQCVAASAYGPPEYKRTWRATDNGLEGVAALHSDMLLVLDELGQLEPRDAGKVAYMLANGQGKSRSHQDGSPRATKLWRVLFLSSGEIGIADLVTQSGGRVRAGQEVRVIDVPADAGKGLGIFENVPVGGGPGQFADTLKGAAATHYGHALPAFVNALVVNPGNARETLRALRAGISAKLVQPDAPGQVRRVADRFALIAAAGELATTWKLTGWGTGEADRAAKTCFAAWLSARGTTGDAEPAAMLAQVRAFLEAHGESRFTRWDAKEDGPRTINRAGFRKDGEDGPTYYIDRECFRREVCSGFDHGAVARVLRDRGALLSERDGDVTRKERLPDGRRVRVYVIAPSLWKDSEDEP